MKKVPKLVLATVFALAVPVIAGCAQDESPLDNDSESGLRVSVIDVGKGDCILLQSGKSAALIDAGYEGTANKVLSLMQKQGIDQLECLVISHYDRDHVGGVRAIGEKIPIDTVYLPGYEGSDKNYRTLIAAIRDLSLPSQQVSKELRLELGDATLMLLPSRVAYIPGTNGEEGNDNDLSLVASLTSGKDSYLFTGDLEKDGIAAFLDAKRGHFDVLKVPHHGQKSSYTDELLEDVQPQIAVITDSADDPADKKTLKLLKENGANTYRTSTSGTIVITSDGAGNYSVSTR